MAERRVGMGLVPLRLFLGATFAFAGIEKLADPAFLTETDPQSLAAQMVRFSQYSPLAPILRALVRSGLAQAAGIGIALSEVAVGLAVLAGIRTRVAAALGVALSLLFFLTVSWPTRPYYYGADLVFAAAFTPLLLLGDGGVLSVEALLRRRAAAGVPASRLVDRRSVLVAFAACWVAVSGVASLFGRRPLRSTHAGQPGMSPTPSGTPTTAPSRQPTRPRPSSSPTPSSPAPSASWSATASPTRPPESPTSGPTAQPTPTASEPRPSPTPSRKPSGTDIGRADEVPVGGALAFQHKGRPGYCYRPADDRFVAYSRVCTHQGCTVDFEAADGGIGGIGATPAQYACPCHGARFDAESGRVAPESSQQGINPLPGIPVRRGDDGRLYAG